MIGGTVPPDTITQPGGNALSAPQHFGFKVVLRPCVVCKARCNSLPILRVEEVEVVLDGFANGNLVHRSRSVRHGLSADQPRGAMILRSHSAALNCERTTPRGVVLPNVSVSATLRPRGTYAAPILMTASTST